MRKSGLTGTRRRARGMSLVEVLVALVVVSIGALSATSLQLITKRSNRDATQRLEATHLASTLVERMRANNSATGLATYTSVAHYSTLTPRPVGGRQLFRSYNLNCAGNAASCCLNTTTVCTSAQTAAVELWQLEQLMDGVMEQIGTLTTAGGLDSPTACVEGPAGTAGFYTVTIAFRGTLAIPEDTTVNCGHNATDAGGTPLYGTINVNEYRRTLTVSAYIAPSVAK